MPDKRLEDLVDIYKSMRIGDRRIILRQLAPAERARLKTALKPPEEISDPEPGDKNAPSGPDLSYFSPSIAAAIERALSPHSTADKSRSHFIKSAIDAAGQTIAANPAHYAAPRQLLSVPFRRGRRDRTP